MITRVPSWNEHQPKRSRCHHLGTVEIIRSPENFGFAGGVKLGLQLLAQDRDTEFYWILNPDCELALGAAEIALHAAKDGDASGGFALLGTRIRYRNGQQSIQSDGGISSRWTGKCRNLNRAARLMMRKNILTTAATSFPAPA